MKKFKTKDEAFASQDFDPNKVKITGVPERHLKAVEAFIKLCVGFDAVNPDYQPDFTNGNWDKYQPWFKMGSPSGAGFAYCDCDYWLTYSYVGARLVAESAEAGNHLQELLFEEYKDMMVYQRPIKKK